MIGRRAGRKEGIKRKRLLSPEGRALTRIKDYSGRIDIVASENCRTRYKKEREKRKHLESGIITRLIIYADHYFDGADRPPSITFVPPLVLSAILFSFKRSRFAAEIPLLILSPHTTRPLFYYPKTLRKCHGQDRYHKFARKNHRKTSPSRLGGEYQVIN